MATPSGESFTELLRRSRSGDQGTLDRLVPLVYDELRSLAARALQRERPSHTLQPTALVNETYLRLFDDEACDLEDRQHFLALAARVMRRVLVEHARRRLADKRGGAPTLLSVDEARDEAADGGAPAFDVLALDEALEELAGLDPRKARVVELRAFSGLTMEDVARALGVSKRTVEGDWYFARAWLRERLG